MSDPIQHECGIALLRLKKPLEYYLDKYGSVLWGLNKMHLLMEKQHNRGQDGAGIANIKLDMQPGERYISRTRSVQKNPTQDIFDQINAKFKAVYDENPAALKDVDYLKRNVGFTGEVFLGHLRYGTYGRNSIESCHPFLRQSNWMTRNLVVAGNLNLTNVDELFGTLVELGVERHEFDELKRRVCDATDGYRATPFWLWLLFFPAVGTAAALQGTALRGTLAGAIFPILAVAVVYGVGLAVHDRVCKHNAKVDEQVDAVLGDLNARKGRAVCALRRDHVGT